MFVNNLQATTRGLSRTVAKTNTVKNPSQTMKSGRLSMKISVQRSLKMRIVRVLETR